MTICATTWRDAAIGEALRAESDYGSSVDALLRLIRLERPGCATLILWDGRDRALLLRFLERHTVGYRTLIAGSDSFGDQGLILPYLGWYAVSWDGEMVEVVLAPRANREGALLLIGADEETLRRFSAALDDFTVRPAGRSLRYTFRWRSAPDIDAELDKFGWDDLVLPAKTLASIRGAVEGFFGHRDAYTAFGFGWRRGILLVGPPGTGKTMLCKAAAAGLPDLPFLYVRDFHANDGQEAVKTIFARARRLAPCILAFEDIDGLVGEENRTVFLNELDGFQSNDGILVIASSNHPDKIDEALLKRPSRFDRVFHIGLPGLEERREFCRRVLARSTLAERRAPEFNAPALATQIAASSEGFTLAYLKEALTGAALNRAQDGAMVLDERFGAAVLAQVEELGKHLRQANTPESFTEWREPGETQVGFRPPRRLAPRA